MKPPSLSLQGGVAKTPPSRKTPKKLTSTEIYKASVDKRRIEKIIQPDLFTYQSPILPENLPEYLESPEAFCHYFCKATSGKGVRNIVEGKMNDLLINHGAQQLPTWMQRILAGTRQPIVNQNGAGVEIHVENLKNGTQRFAVKWFKTGSYKFDIYTKKIIKKVEL